MIIYLIISILSIAVSFARIKCHLSYEVLRTIPRLRVWLNERPAANKVIYHLLAYYLQTELA